MAARYRLSICSAVRASSAMEGALEEEGKEGCCCCEEGGASGGAGETEMTPLGRMMARNISSQRGRSSGRMAMKREVLVSMSLRMWAEEGTCLVAGYSWGLARVTAVRDLRMWAPRVELRGRSEERRVGKEG